MRIRGSLGEFSALTPRLFPLNKEVYLGINPTHSLPRTTTSSPWGVTSFACSVCLLPGTNDADWLSPGINPKSTSLRCDAIQNRASSCQDTIHFYGAYWFGCGALD